MLLQGMKKKKIREKPSCGAARCEEGNTASELPAIDAVPLAVELHPAVESVISLGSPRRRFRLAATKVHNLHKSAVFMHNAVHVTLITNQVQDGRNSSALTQSPGRWVVGGWIQLAGAR